MIYYIAGERGGGDSRVEIKGGMGVMKRVFRVFCFEGDKIFKGKVGTLYLRKWDFRYFKWGLRVRIRRI